MGSPLAHFPVYPATHLQRLWISQYGPGRYRRLHLVSAIRCTGQLSISRLQSSVQWMTRRHEILRCVVAREAHSGFGLIKTSDVQVVVSALDAQGRDIQRVVDEFRLEPFDLHSGPLLRVGVVPLGPHQAICVLVIHHVIADGWSLGVFWSELLRHYGSIHAQRELGLPDAGVQFTDFMLQKEEWLRSAAAEKARCYWRQRFGKFRELARLPGARTSIAAGDEIVSGTLSAEESLLLVQSARVAGVSVSSAVLAGFALLLASWSQGRNISSWVCHTGRRRQETLRAIGCFLDMWILCVRVEGRDSLREAMVAVHSAAIEALAAMDLPGVDIGNELAAAHGDASRPLAAINFLPTPSDRSQGQVGGELICEPLNLASRERYMRTMSGIGLFASVRWNQSVLSWMFAFDPLLLEEADVEHASGHFRNVLLGMASDVQGGVPRWTGPSVASRQ